MGRRRRTGFEGIWVSVPRGTDLAVAELGCSRSSRSVKRYEQDETFVVFSRPSVAETEGIFVGDQLQRDVQHWLSPPDPSTNYNFVRKARHDGTAAWFFESRALTEWKARGSFLWIHGKRMYFERPTNEYPALIVC